MRAILPAAALLLHAPTPSRSIGFGQILLRGDVVRPPDPSSLTANLPIPTSPLLP